ncbi:MAG: ribosome small subunit-dependent GTPase A [Bacteroidota bacterium]
MGAKRRPAPANQMTGTVIRSVGSSSTIRTVAGEVYTCVVRGKFRVKGVKSTNPVAVGDEVRFTPPEEGSEMGVITEVLPRHNYILRKAIAHSRKVHIMAANIDQALLVFTIDFPKTSLGFADRFLLVAEMFHIPAHIIINKTDLLTTPEHQARLQTVRDVYTTAGYPISEVSALSEEYQSTVQELLKDKVSLVGGHSGAGKSTLINLVDPDLDLKTGAVSTANTKGKHTTTYAEMHPLVDGGYIIDTPGIRELGLTNLEARELSHYFPEMATRLVDCKFGNCTHRQEPGCAIRQAVESGEIHPERYRSYLNLFVELQEEAPQYG